MTDFHKLQAFVERFEAIESAAARRAFMRIACQGEDGFWNVPPPGYAQPALVEIQIHGILGSGPTVEDAVDSWHRAASQWMRIATLPGVKGARQDFAFLQAQLPAMALRHSVMLEHFLLDLIQTLAEGMHNCAPGETLRALDIVKERLGSPPPDDDDLIAAARAIHRRTHAAERQLQVAS